ncbi:MAG: PQQ-binding-like beta-propeller repeat protein [bacterium]
MTLCEDRVALRGNMEGKASIKYDCQDGLRKWHYVHIFSPFLSGDRLYIACFAYDKSIARNQQKGWLYCLTMKQGDIIWKIPVTSGILTSPVGFLKNNRLHIIIAARKGLVQCLDVSDWVSKHVWSFQMTHEVFGSPVITDGTTPPLMFLGSKYGNLIAIDAWEGKEVWQKMAGNWIDNTAICQNG